MKVTNEERSISFIQEMIKLASPTIWEKYSEQIKIMRETKYTLKYSWNKSSGRTKEKFDLDKERYISAKKEAERLWFTREVMRNSYMQEKSLEEIIEYVDANLQRLKANRPDYHSFLVVVDEYV